MADILEYRTGDAVPTSVVLANTPAWHETGVVLDTKGEKGLTIEQALPASGLDFTVTKVPIYGPGKPIIKNKRVVGHEQGPLVERRWGVMREDTHFMLGVVGEQWEPMQPIEGFELVDDMIKQAGGDRAWIESAGAIDQARKIWVMVHLDMNLQIAGEAYHSFLLFWTGFDGRLSTGAAAIDERVVCANTLNYAIFGEAQESGHTIRVRHTKNASEKIKEAHRILNLRNKRTEELAKQGEWLVAQSLNEGEFNNFLETLMPVPEGQEGKPTETMIEGRRDQIRKIYFDAPNLSPIRGTRWGAFQAVLEYADHGRKFTDAETQTKAQFGLTKVDIKQQAYNLSMRFAMAS